MSVAPSRALDPLRALAESLRLRIIEVDARTFLVVRMGLVIYRADSLRDLQLFLELRQASA